MQRNGVLIAAGFALVLALVAANVFSNRGTPEPGAAVPDAVVAPHGNPPPLTTSPETPPGRTLSAPQTQGSGR